MTAGFNNGCQHILGNILKARRQGVGQGLASLLKGSTNGAEQGLLVLGNVGLLLMKANAYYRRVYLGSGDKVSCADLEELFGLAVIIDYSRNGAVFFAACFCTETVSHLGLDHDGDIFKGKIRFQQFHQNRRCDVVGQVGADRDLPCFKGGGKQGFQIGFHNVPVDDFNHPLGAILKGVTQDGNQPVVDLYR